MNNYLMCSHFIPIMSDKGNEEQDYNLVAGWSPQIQLHFIGHLLVMHKNVSFRHRMHLHS